MVRIDSRKGFGIELGFAPLGFGLGDFLIPGQAGGRGFRAFQKSVVLGA